MTALAIHYRCTACGNRTRFDVTATRQTRSFHHYSIGGELTVDEVVVLSEVVDEVSCRWCASSTAVETLSPSAADEQPSADPSDTAVRG